MSPNEARRALDLPPVPGGDAVLSQQQNFSLEALAERDADKPFSKPTVSPEAQPAKGVSGMLYRGIFVDGEEYRQGEFVTHGGSMWHCKEDTTDRPPGSTAWQLAVKRGRNGKDVGE